ncbi:hypothetical protein AKJ59_00155 [candidate division MSBL1 archaeon SCGC-AAA385M02]|uniref:Uncharacterized protein n=1 Tax=candidate division MSBL1 archaeon SCGC-AAA385M02 TaxID=1698287 RepID=A0A133VR43_9EURY|nr:hypothetical protein AKJ59_00155 [candidate division MSBL1 archaeon SCGC-AAA385M02]
MYKSMPIVYSVFDETSNPLYGGLMTRVSIEDETDVPFITLEQPTIEDETIRLEMEELEEITRVSRRMIDNYNRQTEEK